MKKKYHYLYKITCIKTNRFYIGIHSTFNLDDGYFGSGLVVQRSIRRHGKDNHTRVILEWFDSRESLAAREREIVNCQLVADKMCMNLKEGGDGGFTTAQQKENNRRSQIRQAELRQDPEWAARRSRRGSEANKRAYNEGRKHATLKPHVVGSTLSDVTKKRISESMQGKYDGKNNPRAIRLLDESGIQYDCLLDAAKAYKVTSETISRWIKKGKFKKLP